MMFWLCVKIALLALYILSALGVIIKFFTFGRIVGQFVEANDIPSKSFSLPERIQGIITLILCVFCPIFNFLMFLNMVYHKEECLITMITEVMDTSTSSKED